MLRFFERFLEPTAHSPDAPPPVLGSPQALIRFYWHFVRQIPGPLAALFATGFCVAITDALIPVCLGRIVSLVSSTAPEAIWPEAGGQLLLMAALFLVFRPAAHFAQLIVANLMLVPGLTNLVRWQSHWHVVRQGWTFFQNDFAGRIAARVMQTGRHCARASCCRSSGFGTSSFSALSRSAFYRPPIGGSVCRSSPGSCFTSSCLATFCRRCASVRAPCRRCVRS